GNRGTDSLEGFCTVCSECSQTDVERHAGLDQRGELIVPGDKVVERGGFHAADSIQSAARDAAEVEPMRTRARQRGISAKGRAVRSLFNYPASKMRGGGGFVCES